MRLVLGLVAAFAGIVAVFMVVMLACAALSPNAAAHDDAEWIQKGKHSWCCGVDDCEATHAVPIGTTSYMLWTGEVWPRSQTLPSVNDQFWVCRNVHGDWSIRCFFAPEPST